MEEPADVDTPGPWFCRTAEVTAPVRLFYFPYAGGNAAAILRWQAHLGTAVELHVAALPGRGARLFEEPPSDLDDLVAHLTGAVADLADRRFAFFGHSLGALVAFEVARALRRQSLPGPECLWVSGAEGPQTRSVKHRLHHLPEDEFIEALRDYRGTPAEVLADQEMMELLSPGIRADFALSERYAYRPEPPLDLPIHVLRGDRDPYVEADRAVGWALETTRPLREYVYRGDHFFIQPHETDIAALVVAEFAGERANPYRSLPPRSFWRTAVAEPAADDIGHLWQPKFAVGQDAPILTAGSCFARHIGRALLGAGMNWHDAEPPPPGLTAAQREARHYGEFSFRTGNIYTAAMLRQWLSWAFGAAAPPVGEADPPVGEADPPVDGTTVPAGVWAEGGRYFDPYRPAVEPGGHPSAEAVRAARDETLAAIRGAVGRAACLVFTLGLTEAWHDTDDGTVYPVCPGTVRGTFDERRHVFRNATFAEVYRDLSAAVALARAASPDLRVVLTVSPVPLTATATGGHALVATTYSKSVLRAVAGQLAAELGYVDYFPSYELITGSPFGARFFEPNLRTVTPEGVAFVMRHFRDAFGPRAGPPVRTAVAADGGDPYCDDAVLDYYRAR
jgi:surfactin synthase thioesterase subunit